MNGVERLRRVPAATLSWLPFDNLMFEIENREQLWAMQTGLVARRVGMPVFGQRDTAAIGSGRFGCESRLREQGLPCLSCE